MRHPRSYLRLSAALHAELIEHAVATPVVEVCGLLGGHEEQALSLYRVRNIDENPAVAFLMAPGEQLAAWRLMGARGETLVGIYHSHPTSPAEPSARDLAEAAYPEAAFLVVSLVDATDPALAAFAFNGAVFTPLPLVLGQDPTPEVDTRNVRSFPTGGPAA